jgi:nucleotide-binding universal stress UspA family protein
VIVAFDGSAEARAAVEAAADLFPGRELLIVSVWEAGLGLLANTADPDWVAYAPDPQYVEAVDHAQEQHSVEAADGGVQLAIRAGAKARGIPVQDSADVAQTVVALAEEHDAAAVVIGSRGRGGVRGYFGSTSRRLLHDSTRPVLVVRAAPVNGKDRSPE